jgi:hypothetical protein
MSQNWCAGGPKGADKPTWLMDENGNVIVGRPAVGDAPLHTYQTENRDDAIAGFNALKRTGIAAISGRHGIQRDGQRWTMPGSPHYLDRQAARLGVSQVQLDQCAGNAQLKEVVQLVSQIHINYYANRPLRADGKVQVHPPEARRIRETLLRARGEAGKLHAMAAAARAIIDDCVAAIAIDAIDWPYEVLAQSDGPAADPIETAGS